MKFSVIGPTYPFRGGIAHYTSLLVDHLRQQHDVQFISYLKQYPKWLYPGNTAMDPSPDSSALRVECDRVLSPLNPFTWWRAYQKILAYQPDVLLLQWWTPFWSPMLFFLTRLIRQKTKTRIVFLCHHIISPDGGMFDWYLLRRILWRGHAFIVMSEEDFALLRRALPWGKIRGVTHPPYDIFSRQPIPRAVARAKLNLPNDEPVLLFFGFVRRYKGLKYLINALPAIREHFPARLLVVGEFWEDERPYRDLVRQLGLNDVVQFYPSYVPNEELAVYFCAADAVIMPYLEATQSGVAQIAIGFEVPMIATSVGGMPEAIKHEQHGLIVPPGDEAALSDAVIRLFRDNLGPQLSANLRIEKENASWGPLIQLIEELSLPTAISKSEQPNAKTASPRVL
jgi:glycosyltransferase involved in cell wall biosynthesis